ncbi:helix-turn-helix transcriptional regulator [Erythrobacter sp. SG61-1L]|uniref:S24 family peptidase n=1 Tax=Erythrobacter sp. SG61-1L TaxID=1603897 RepID=UPI0019D70EFC|nr:helix-turn-helix transcriptional regulator [Erythrobacter sp. SG61-1L]
MKLPDNPGEAGRWCQKERDRRKMSAADLAARINGLALEAGDPFKLSQQNLSKFEQGNNKRMPPWTRFIIPALQAADGETSEDPHLHMGLVDASVEIQVLPTWAGMGMGGTGDDDPGLMSFSRDLIERELKASPQALLAMAVEGNSMEPEFFGGDVLLVDTRRRSLAQPGAFCLWDGDGHVIKYLEKVPGSDPPLIRVISRNSMYQAHERLADEISVIGRVVWFGRRIL